MSDVKLVLSQAKEKIKNPDMIIDPYDFTFFWVSKEYCKLTGYEESELIDMQVFPTSKIEPCELRRMQIEMIYQKKLCFREMPIKRKDGKCMHVKIRDVCIHVDEQPYIVGEIVKVLKK